MNISLFLFSINIWFLKTLIAPLDVEKSLSALPKLYSLYERGKSVVSIKLISFSRVICLSIFSLD